MSCINDDLILRIVQGCQCRNEESSSSIPHDLAAFVAHIVEKRVKLQNDRDEVSCTNCNINESIDDIVVQQQTINLLCGSDYSPWMETIRMQLSRDVYCLEYMLKGYPEKKETLVWVEKAQDWILSKIACVAATQNNNTSVEHSMYHHHHQATGVHNTIYRDIFVFVVKVSYYYGLVSSRQDDTKMRAFRQEVGTAMESAFPPSKLKSFLLLTSEEQKIHLQQLPSLVMGMILVSAASKTGMQKIGMRAIDKFYHELVPNFLSTTTADAKIILCEIIPKYESSLLTIGGSATNRSNHNNLLLQELIFYRQLHRYVHNILISVSALHENSKEFLTMFHREVNDVLLAQTPSMKAPFAKFIVIGNLWTHLNYLYDVIKSYIEIFANLQRFRMNLVERFGEDPLQLKHNNNLETTVEDNQEGRSTAAFGEDDVIHFPKDNDNGDKLEAELLHVESDEDYTNLRLEFNGFCPWSIAAGLLIEGNHLQSGGIVCFQKKYYTFANERGRLSFMKQPIHILRKAAAVIIEIPSLIRLLDDCDWFPTYAHLRRDRYELSRPDSPVKKDVTTSTPVHFFDLYIDPNYVWNEWDLRRKAIQMSNATTLAVTSIQTE